MFSLEEYNTLLCAAEEGNTDHFTACSIPINWERGGVANGGEGAREVAEAQTVSKPLRDDS